MLTVDGISLMCLQIIQIFTVSLLNVLEELNTFQMKRNNDTIVKIYNIYVFV